MVTSADSLLLAGVVLALGGAVSVLVDAAQSGGNPRFIGYLIGLLLSLSGVGLVLAATL
jgi:hypothetical protein